MRKPRRILKSVGLSLFAISLASSCGTTRVVFVNQGDLIRLGPDVRGTVYVHTGGAWVKSKNKVQLPEGWIAGPLPPKED